MGTITCLRETRAIFVFDLARQPRAGRLFHVNGGRASFRNEFRSGLKVVQESCKQALTHLRFVGRCVDCRLVLPTKCTRLWSTTQPSVTRKALLRQTV